MLKYEKIIEEYDEELIIEERADIHLDGLYADGCVWIRKDMTSARKAAVLAEEIGHHMTSVGDILDQDDISNAKQEYRARSWAHEKMIPFEKIIEAFQAKHGTPHEMAEYLDVDEEFLREYLERMGMLR